MLSQEQVAFDGREVGIVVDTAGIADVSVVRTFDGAAAMNLRSGCGGSADALARMVAGEEGASSARTEACDEPGKPLVVRYVCTEEVEREEDGTLRLAPFGAVFPGDNPFGQTTVRHFPVDIVFQTRGCLSGAYRNSTGVPGEKPAVRHESRRRNLPVHV